MTGVRLRDTTNTIFHNFALECDSSERLVFLFRVLWTVIRTFVWLLYVITIRNVICVALVCIQGR